VLLDRRYESPDPAEIHSALFAPERPGEDLLFQFHHVEVSLGLIIGEWDGEILYECQDLFQVFVAPTQEILCFWLFLSAVFSLLL